MAFGPPPSRGRRQEPLGLRYASIGGSCRNIVPEQRISIWERGAASAILTSRFCEGIWSSSLRPDDWLKSYWSQPATSADIQDIERGWALVLDLMRSRGATAGEIAAAKVQADLAISSPA